MPKIVKLIAVDNFDVSYVFDTVYSHVDVVFCSNYHDIFLAGDRIPVVNHHALESDSTLLAAMIQYLQDPLHKAIYLDLREGYPYVPNRLDRMGLIKYCNSNQILIVSSGSFANWSHANIDFFQDITGSTYNQIVTLNYADKIFNLNKPYKFLFLNGYKRQHRIDMIAALFDLLDQSLWSDLANNIVLPKQYIDFFNNQLSDVSILKTSHNNSWPDGILIPELYIDTYFSVVCETNYTVPYEYRTEKIYKPLMIGHPFVAVAQQGFYKDLHNQGYKTFNNLLDESFDSIENNSLRLSKTAAVIKDLCQQDLGQFITAAKPICEYNRELFFEKIGKNKINQYNSIVALLEKI